MRCRCAAVAAQRRGHEVLHLPHAVAHQEARDEHVGVGEVELLGAPAVAVGRDPEQARRGRRRGSPRRRSASRTAGSSTSRSSRRCRRARRCAGRRSCRARRSAGSAPARAAGVGHDLPCAISTDVERHQRASSSAHGTSTSLPFDAELSSSSCAWRASASGRRSRDDRVDLALTEQLDQRAEVLPEPLRVHGLPAHCSGSPGRTCRGTSGRGRRTPSGGARACPRATRWRSPRTT